MYTTDHISKKWFKKQLKPDEKLNKSFETKIYRKNAPIIESNQKSLNLKSIKSDKKHNKSYLLSSAMHTIFNNSYKYTTDVDLEKT